MKSPALAVALELWSRNRWALGSVAIGLPLSLIPVGENLRVFQALFFFFAIAILFWSFAYAEVDSRGRHMGFPSRMFILPMRTSLLAGLPMIYGACTITLFYLFWSQLILPMWGVQVSEASARVHALALVAMLLSLQAIVWSLYRFPWIRLSLLLVIMVGIGALGIVAPAQDFRKITPAAVEVTLAGLALLAFIAGIAGVSRDRRGDWDGWTQRIMDRIAGLLPHGRAPFASAGDAQLWFEWRGKAMFSCALLLFGMLFPLLIFPLPAAVRFDGGAAASFYAALPLMMLVGSWSLGFNLARTDYWSRNAGLSPFITARPLSSGDIVMAKLKAAALLVMTVWLLFALLAVPVFNVLHWCLYSEEHPFPSLSEFLRQNPALIRAVSHPVIVLTAMCVMWTTIVDSLSLGLKARTPQLVHTIVRVGVVIGGMILVACLAGGPAGRRWLLNGLPWVTGIMAAWKIGSTAVAFARARRLYSQRQLLAVVTLWLAAAGLLAWTVFLVWTGVSAIDRIIVFLAAWLLPGAALARAPFNLDSTRHG